MELFLFAIICIYTFFIIKYIYSIPVRPSPTLTPPTKRAVKGFHTEMKLTMKTVIRWEQLVGRPFSCMDYSCESDIEALFYCSASCSNIAYTLEEFRHVFTNDKIAKDIAKAFARESAIMRQFQPTNSQEANAIESDSAPGYIKDIVSLLIMNGLDAKFGMDMELCDLPLFIEAYQNKKKERMESERLWTYLNILPHVDGKKLRSARDLYPFPWEEAEILQAAEKSIQEDAEKLQAFFEQGENIIRQNYGG